MSEAPAAVQECSPGAPIAANVDRTARYLSQAPESQRLTLSRALEGTASPRAAIRAKCLDCCAFDRNEVRYCPAILCALHRYRPFQDAANVDA